RFEDRVPASASGADRASDRRIADAAPPPAPRRRGAAARLGLTMRGRAAAAEAAAAEAGPALPAPEVVARLVALDPGLFAFSIAGAARWPGIAPGLGVPAVHVSSLHGGDDGSLEITDAAGAPGAWLGGPSPTLLVRAPARGGAALVTAYLGHDPATPPQTPTFRPLHAATEPPPRPVSFATPPPSTP